MDVSGDAMVPNSVPDALFSQQRVRHAMGTMGLWIWNYGAMGLWSYGAMGRWNFGTLVNWGYGTLAMGLWGYGAMGPSGNKTPSINNSALTQAAPSAANVSEYFVEYQAALARLRST